VATGNLRNGRKAYQVDIMSPTARLKTPIDDELMKRALACVEQLWPSEGVAGIGRFVRDAIRRYLRYCKNGRT
jgi:hypothetical protein